MSNLMLNHLQWSDYHDGSFPTDAWGGSDYGYTYKDPGVQNGQDYHIQSIAGDSIDFAITISSDPAPFAGDPFFVNVIDRNSSTIINSYGPYTSADSGVEITQSYVAGLLFSVYICTNNDDIFPAIGYAGGVTFTPLGEVSIVAPDESLHTVQNTPVSVMPIITQDGSPVTPDSLSLVGGATNGIPSVDGLTLTYTPNEGYVGTDSFQYKATLGGVDSNTATVNVNVTVPSVSPCKELGRTTKTYVTGYSLSRVNVARVRRMAKRCVVANFNGALDPSRSIVSVRWETTSPWSIFMSNARVASNGRETMVDVSFNFSGWGGLLATATLDNGEIYNAEFSFTVLDTPLYPSATYPLGQGPFRLDATT